MDGRCEYRLGPLEWRRPRRGLGAAVSAGLESMARDRNLGRAHAAQSDGLGAEERHMCAEAARAGRTTSPMACCCGSTSTRCSTAASSGFTPTLTACLHIRGRMSGHTKQILATRSFEYLP